MAWLTVLQTLTGAAAAVIALVGLIRRSQANQRAQALQLTVLCIREESTNRRPVTAYVRGQVSKVGTDYRFYATVRWELHNNSSLPVSDARFIGYQRPGRVLNLIGGERPDMNDPDFVCIDGSGGRGVLRPGESMILTFVALPSWPGVLDHAEAKFRDNTGMHWLRSSAGTLKRTEAR